MMHSVLGISPAAVTSTAAGPMSFSTAAAT